MELHLPKRINPFFWSMFPFVFGLVGYYQIFISWEIPQFGFRELEDVWRLAFILFTSSCEAAWIIVILWIGIQLLKKWFKSAKQKGVKRDDDERIT
ncbi:MULTISPECIES: hypothetical protein [unclassified Exiguobacterium]|uniref:hypothetical protein n=1 Tax=unclassified Exiguobacterium TaxID=2644629 RepID=UPI00103D1D87|nr:MULTISPECIES: hypothetical protein [unclassified Exiguobacterium]TCI43487.1 hypothetical protein EVJ31_11480 [Exiguobacterium sp. SH5S32]TCI52435.1 hypothetical protein EVJ25_06675 [Exiguobacterium sp. SH1S4]TCI68742.1 hypothetical protein EVJ23_11470 [Exiguobacterium sp. SH1S1]